MGGPAWPGLEPSPGTSWPLAGGFCPKEKVVSANSQTAVFKHFPSFSPNVKHSPFITACRVSGVTASSSLAPQARPPWGHQAPGTAPGVSETGVPTPNRRVRMLCWCLPPLTVPLASEGDACWPPGPPQRWRSDPMVPPWCPGACQDSIRPLKMTVPVRVR